MKSLLVALVTGVSLLSASETARAQGFGLFGRNRAVYVESSPYYHESSYPNYYAGSYYCVRSEMATAAKSTSYPNYYAGSYYYPTTSSWNYPTRTYGSYYVPPVSPTPYSPMTTYSAPTFVSPSGPIQSAAYVPSPVVGSPVMQASATAPLAMPLGTGPIMKEAPSGSPAPTNQPPEGLNPQQDASPVTIPGYDLYFQNGRYYHVKK